MIHRRTFAAMMLCMVAGWSAGALDDLVGVFGAGFVVGAFVMLLALAVAPDAEQVAIEWREHGRISDGREGRS